MPSPVVIDASVAASFLLREPSAETFADVVLQLADGAVELHTPALFIFELTNILAMAERHKRISSGIKQSLFAEVASIPRIDAPIPGLPTIQRIADLAQRHRLTAYDATYLELAERLGATLVTLDSDLLRLRKTYRWIR